MMPVNEESCTTRLLWKVLALALLLGVALSQDYDYGYPMYSENNMPDTSFSCRDKINGGYYADIETDCQMYHVCSKNRFGELRSTRFLCGNGTVFDQRHLVCQDYRKVQHCQNSDKYFRTHAHHVLQFLEKRLKEEDKNPAIAKARQFDSLRN